VGKIPLSHRKLGDVAVSFGEGKLGDADALFVVTDSGSGSKGTIRLDDGRTAQLSSACDSADDDGDDGG
jgi:hypothetical protein